MCRAVGARERGDLADRGAGEDEAHGARDAADLEHRERKRHGRERAAEPRDRPAHEQEPEVALRERSERSPDAAVAHDPSVGNSAARLGDSR
jgi:hypothetical protein